MLLMTYPTTALEEWVTELYKRLKIFHPRQINIDCIARRYDIYIHRKPLPAYFQIIGRYRGITIDIRQPKDIQKEQFFHELCHILRHSGVQSMMPAAFRELQEWDARHFVSYAAIPHHMLQFIDINDEHVIDQMIDIFEVTPELCKERLERIKDRTLYHRQLAEQKTKNEFGMDLFTNRINC